MPELFEVIIRATGEVRDADGNLVSSEPIESSVLVTKEQALELLTHLEPKDVSE